MHCIRRMSSVVLTLKALPKAFFYNNFAFFARSEFLDSQVCPHTSFPRDLDVSILASGGWWWSKPNMRLDSKSTLGWVELTCSGDGVEMEWRWSWDGVGSWVGAWQDQFLMLFSDAIYYKLTFRHLSVFYCTTVQVITCRLGKPLGAVADGFKTQAVCNILRQ